MSPVRFPVPPQQQVGGGDVVVTLIAQRLFDLPFVVAHGHHVVDALRVRLGGDLLERFELVLFVGNVHPFVLHDVLQTGAFHRVEHEELF